MLRPIADAYRRAYSGLPRALWSLAAVTFVYRSGTMVLPFLVLYLTSQKGLRPGEAGVVLSLYGVGAIAGAVLGGRLSDAFGPWASQGGMLVAASGLFLLLGWVEGIAAIGVVVVLLSVAAEGFRPANAAAFVLLAPPDVRARAFALRRLAVNLGMTFGPAAGGLLAAVGYGWLFVANSATSGAAALTLFVLFHHRGAGRRDAEGAGPEPSTPAHGSGLFPIVLVLVGGLAVVFFQLLGTFPLTLYEVHGFSERGFGALLAVNTLLIVALEMVLVGAVERRERLSVVAVGTLFLGGGFAMVAEASTWPLALLSTTIWTVGEMLTFPLLESWVADRTPAGRRGRMLGLYTAAFSVAFVVAPLAGTAVYERLGPRPLWYGCGAVATLLAAAFAATGSLARRANGRSAPRAKEDAADD